MFPLFKSDRFNVFKKGEYGKKLHKEGERERGSRQEYFHAAFVCTSLSAVTYSMSALINEKSLSLPSPVIGCRFHMLSMHVHPGQIQSSTIPSVLISPSSLSSLLQLKWEKEPGWRSHSRLWKYHLRASPLLPPHSSCSFHKFKLEICFFLFF